MKTLFLLLGAFAFATAVAALVARFSASRARSPSAEEKHRRLEVAKRSAESNRKLMQWVSSVILCALAIAAVALWLSDDLELKRFGFYPLGAVTITVLTLWAKTRDDGLNPQLRKKPNQALEPTPTAVTSAAEQPPRRP